MLSAIRVSDQKKVNGPYSKKYEGPFESPECREQVSLRECLSRIDHFAHRPKSICGYGQGETELHRTAKWELYDSLKGHPDITCLELERSLLWAKPDISFYLREEPVVIEVQGSDLPLDEIILRTRHYTEHKIATLWVDLRHRYDHEQFLPKPWEQWLHALGFGYYYQWRPGMGHHFEQLHLERVTRKIRSAIIQGSVSLFQLEPLWRREWQAPFGLVPECFYLSTGGAYRARKLDRHAFGMPVPWTKEEQTEIMKELLAGADDQTFC